MKTVEFKDLPNKVRGLIIRLNDSIYNEDYRIDLYCLHKWNKWSQATDEERLAYAEWRYKFGVRLKDAYDDEEYDLKLRDTIFYLEKDPRSPHDIILTRHEHHTDITIYDSDKNKWAEIIEEPEKEDEIIEEFVDDFTNKMTELGSKFKPEFKAGDEAVLDGSGAKTVFTIIHIFDGMAWIKYESMMFGRLVMLHRLRKPDPDAKLKEIASEIIANEGLLFTQFENFVTGLSNDRLKKMLIEALKKGKSL